MKIKQRFPNYCEGFEEEEADVQTLDELKSIPFVKRAIESKNFYGLYNSKSSFQDNPDILMALYNYDEKYGGCKTWWAIGYIYGSGNELGLEEWEKYAADHLEGCSQKEWQHNECTCGFKPKK